MNVLIACEESQSECLAFRRKGHNAYSCDLKPCSGGFPGYHIIGDVSSLLNGNCSFITMDGRTHSIYDSWDLIIAHPPCTFLTYAGNRHFYHGSLDSIISRWNDRCKAIAFFYSFFLCNAKRLCVENPVGIMNTIFRPPDFILHPYYFAEEDSSDFQFKRSCYWIRNLPPITFYNPFSVPSPCGYSPSGKAYYFVESVSSNRSENRSKSFSSISDAMAEQWNF